MTANRIVNIRPRIVLHNSAILNALNIETTTGRYTGCRVAVRRMDKRKNCKPTWNCLVCILPLFHRLTHLLHDTICTMIINNRTTEVRSKSGELSIRRTGTRRPESVFGDDEETKQGQGQTWPLCHNVHGYTINTHGDILINSTITIYRYSKVRRTLWIPSIRENTTHSGVNTTKRWRENGAR